MTARVLTADQQSLVDELVAKMRSYDADGYARGLRNLRSDVRRNPRCLSVEVLQTLGEPLPKR